MKDYTYYKEIMINYSLIIIICLFLVVYIVINYSIVHDGNIYDGNIPKTIIITGIIFLILYIFLTWEDDNEEEIVLIPKYKIVNKININDNIRDNDNNYNNKYTKNNPENFINNNDNKQEYITRQNNSVNKLEISDKLDHSNIFVPQKNKAKFGIKF
jgi:hypothetical protein